MPTQFTPREQEILALVARGHRLKEVAHDLHLSAATIKDTLRQMYARDGLTGLAHAMAVWMEWRALRKP